MIAALSFRETSRVSPRVVRKGKSGKRTRSRLTNPTQAICRGLWAQKRRLTENVRRIGLRHTFSGNGFGLSHEKADFLKFLTLI